MHIRPIQWQLARTSTPDDSPYKHIRVPHALHCHLRWWGCSHAMHNGTFLHDPQPQAIVFTDASDTGWGAHCMGEEIQGSWLPSEKHLHINILEMKAVLIAIRHFAETLRGKSRTFLVRQFNDSLASQEDGRSQSLAAKCLSLAYILQSC